MEKSWSEKAWDDYLWWQSQDRKTLRRINALIKSIERSDGKPMGKAEMLKEVRRIVPKHFLLVPGVGAQGGSLEEVCKNGFVEGEAGLLINASRSIIYASKGEDFAEAAAAEARRMQQQMATYL